MRWGRPPRNFHKNVKNAFNVKNTGCSNLHKKPFALSTDGHVLYRRKNTSLKLHIPFWPDRLLHFVGRP